MDIMLAHDHGDNSTSVLDHIESLEIFILPVLCHAHSNTNCAAICPTPLLRNAVQRRLHAAFGETRYVSAVLSASQHCH